MLQQDPQTQQDQNHTASHLRFLFEAAAEEIADFYTGGAESAGTQMMKSYKNKI